MNVLIVAEKPSVSRAIAPAARQHWPAASISFVHAVPYGNLRFAYPRGLKMADFPTLSEPRNRLSSWDTWSCPPVVMSSTGALAPTTLNMALFENADILVFACDPGHTGAVGFEVMMREVFGDDRAAQCSALYLNSLDSASAAAAFAKMAPFNATFQESLEYGRIKRYFDWNWNVNGLAILGEAQVYAGVSRDAAPLSKYALQLMYHFRNAGPDTEGNTVNCMSHWHGTGRYNKPSTSLWRVSVGSCASRGQIIENLLAAGLLEKLDGASRPLLQLSTLGHTLLDHLHPDCEDQDLPFRLHSWCEQGEAAKPTIDRYINTYFGKQMRFLARLVRS